jgi:hypothetical protein
MIKATVAGSEHIHTPGLFGIPITVDFSLLMPGSCDNNAVQHFAPSSFWITTEKMRMKTFRIFFLLFGRTLQSTPMTWIYLSADIENIYERIVEDTSFPSRALRSRVFCIMGFNEAGVHYLSCNASADARSL